MADDRKPGPEELERRVRLLQEAVSRMSVDELCKLIRDIQARIRDRFAITAATAMIGTASFGPY